MSKRVGLRHLSSIIGKIRRVILLSPEGENGGYYDNIGPFDPAWNYDNLVGAMWMEGPGHSGYDVAPTGQIEVREPSGESPLADDINGGYYDNRV